jgi:hypothetical protein
LLVSLFPLQNRSEAIEPVKENDIIYWNSTSKGDIYSWDTSNDPPTYELVGYADGMGKIEIKRYSVLENQTLIIEEGVEIYLEDAYKNSIHVFGGLKVLGSKTNKVLFESNIPDDVNGWYSFAIEEGDKPVEINNASFSHISNTYIYREIVINNCFFQGDGDFQIRNDQRMIEKVEITNTLIGNSEYTVESIIGIDWSDIDELIFIDNQLSGIKGNSLQISGNNIKFLNNDIENSRFTVFLLSASNRLELSDEISNIDAKELNIGNYGSRLILENSSISSDAIVLRGEISVSDCLIYGILKVKSHVSIYNSIIIGGLFFIDGIVFKHIFFRGEIIFNIKDSIYKAI